MIHTAGQVTCWASPFCAATQQNTRPAYIVARLHPISRPTGNPDWEGALRPELPDWAGTLAQSGNIVTPGGYLEKRRDSSLLCSLRSLHATQSWTYPHPQLSPSTVIRLRIYSDNKASFFINSFFYINLRNHVIQRQPRVLCVLRGDGSLVRDGLQR